MGLRVGEDEAGFRPPRRALPRHGEQRLRDVEPRGAALRPGTLGGGERGIAGTAADVEHILARCGGGAVEKLGRDRGKERVEPRVERGPFQPRTGSPERGLSGIGAGEGVGWGHVRLRRGADHGPGAFESPAGTVSR